MIYLFFTLVAVLSVVLLVVCITRILKRDVDLHDFLLILLVSVIPALNCVVLAGAILFLIGHFLEKADEFFSKSKFFKTKIFKAK